MPACHCPRADEYSWGAKLNSADAASAAGSTDCGVKHSHVALPAEDDTLELAKVGQPRRQPAKHVHGTVSLQKKAPPRSRPRPAFVLPLPLPSHWSGHARSKNSQTLLKHKEWDAARTYAHTACQGNPLSAEAWATLSKAQYVQNLLGSAPGFHCRG